MDLVLGLTTAIASIIAFSIGFIFGKMKQADKDKTDVYDAILQATYKLDETQVFDKKPTDWIEGKSNACQTILSFINQAFYGKR